MNRNLHRQLSIVLAILGLLVSGQVSAIAVAPQVPEELSPPLVEALVVPQQGALTVTGQDFTPGGQVYIALYDRWGVQLFETRWVTASNEMFGMNGSRDPALGYVGGGTINETFGASGDLFGPNGSRDPALGYTPGSGRSDVAAESLGPNGSRDPAMVNVPDDTDTELASNLCTVTIMVRALDEARDTWSNMLDVDTGCA